MPYELNLNINELVMSVLLCSSLISSLYFYKSKVFIFFIFVFIFLTILNIFLDYKNNHVIWSYCTITTLTIFLTFKIKGK